MARATLVTDPRRDDGPCGHPHPYTEYRQSCPMSLAATNPSIPPAASHHRHRHIGHNRYQFSECSNGKPYCINTIATIFGILRILRSRRIHTPRLFTASCHQYPPPSPTTITRRRRPRDHTDRSHRSPRRGPAPTPSLPDAASQPPTPRLPTPRPPTPRPPTTRQPTTRPPTTRPPTTRPPTPTPLPDPAHYLT